jgi:hypothetical protein
MILLLRQDWYSTTQVHRENNGLGVSIHVLQSHCQLKVSCDTASETDERNLHRSIQTADRHHITLRIPFLVSASIAEDLLVRCSYSHR